MENTSSGVSINHPLGGAGVCQLNIFKNYVKLFEVIASPCAQRFWCCWCCC